MRLFERKRATNTFGPLVFIDIEGTHIDAVYSVSIVADGLARTWKINPHRWCSSDPGRLPHPLRTPMYFLLSLAVVHGIPSPPWRRSHVQKGHGCSLPSTAPCTSAVQKNASWRILDMIRPSSIWAGDFSLPPSCVPAHGGIQEGMHTEPIGVLRSPGLDVEKTAPLPA